MQKKIRLDGRLSACARWVREGAVLADIGTDHAYLPAALAAEGKISSAVASDIGDGPLENARRTIEAGGAENMITVFRADGLAGIDRFSPTDIVIAGMGGETIMNILSAVRWLTPDMRLILQPMTRQPELWRYLAAEGYTVTASDLASAEAPRSSGKNNEKIYSLIICSAGGESWEISDFDAVTGLYRCAASMRLQTERVEKTLEYMKEISRGLRDSGSPDEKKRSRVTSLIDEMNAFLRKHGDPLIDEHK